MRSLHLVPFSLAFQDLVPGYGLSILGAALEIGTLGPEAGPGVASQLAALVPTALNLAAQTDAAPFRLGGTSLSANCSNTTFHLVCRSIGLSFRMDFKANSGESSVTFRAGYAPWLETSRNSYLRANTTSKQSTDNSPAL